MDSFSLQPSDLGTVSGNGSSFSLMNVYIGDAKKMHVCGLTDEVLLTILTTMNMCPYNL